MLTSSPIIPHPALCVLGPPVVCSGFFTIRMAGMGVTASTEKQVMKDGRYSPPFRPMVSAGVADACSNCRRNDLDALAVVNGIENRTFKTSGSGGTPTVSRERGSQDASA